MSCDKCYDTGKILEDHDGRVGYRKCDCGAEVKAKSTQRMPEPALDYFDQMFKRQERFMELLREHDKLPEFPVDLTTKPGQRLCKEAMFCMVEELMEASFTLKNKMHRITDARLLDIDHYREELGDALAFWMEICILSGFSPKQMFDEYCRKNDLVVERLRNGY